MFLLGHWKNFEELESNLCIDELIVIIDSMRKKENREWKFHAALQGVDLDEGASPKSNDEEIDDIKSLRGFQAAEAGFGIGAGLGYAEIGN